MLSCDILGKWRSDSVSKVRRILQWNIYVSEKLEMLGAIGDKHQSNKALGVVGQILHVPASYIYIYIYIYYI